MLDLIAKPFGVLLLWLYGLVSNYGVAIILFAVIVKLIMLPFQMKSKRGMMRMGRLNGKMQELQKRHEGNQRKYQEEVAKLYQSEGVNPMSGCIWTLIPFPILLALYRAIRFPLTVMMGVPASLLEEGGTIAQKLTETGFSTSLNPAYIQLAHSEWISEHWADFAPLSNKLVQINYKFLGMNLGRLPQWNFFTKVDWSDTSDWLPALLLFLVPIVSAFMSWLSMKVSQSTNPSAGSAAQQQAQAQMKGMNLMMPLMSLYFCFIMPAALGIYWIANSVLAMVQELILNKYYKKILDAEDAERLEKEKLRLAEMERKRQETERLKAEGATQISANTSKKKQKAQQKAELDELRAAAIREERAERRKKLGIVEEEKPASQVGNRRYARGRAYVPDRFTNPERAAEATAAAAAESEGAPSLDEGPAEGSATERREALPETEEGQENVFGDGGGNDASEDEDFDDEYPDGDEPENEEDQIL